MEVTDLLRTGFVDVCGISETKLDDNFTSAQFHIENFTMYTVKIETAMVVVYWLIFALTYHIGIEQTLSTMKMEMILKQWFLKCILKRKDG